MFSNQDLENALAYSHTIESSQAIFVEWNLNQSYNISKVGNYRYRPGTTDYKYGTIKSTYDEVDTGSYYTGATDSDTLINAGFNDSDQPAIFVAPKKKINLLYSLDDCFKQNRPRSGINKILYFGVVGSGHNQYIDSLTKNGEVENENFLSTVNIARRPRYYMSSRYDDFKYWTSYRTEADTENNITNEYGIAQNRTTGVTNASYYINDAAPFVVYNEKVPTNKIVIKMQTNVGDINNGPYRISDSFLIDDPLYGYENQTTPVRWSVQTLDENNNWVEAISFTESSTRSDLSPIIGSDGQVEIEYGLVVPTIFQDVFTFAGEISSISMRPDFAPYGYAYLYKENETDKGTLYISDGANWNTYDPEYSWKVANVDITKNTKIVSKLFNPSYFIENEVRQYREFQFVKGMRIVVDTMNKVNSTFDLIEFSPRLVADISDKTISFNVTKTLSDLGTHSMPTGGLIASTGSISIFDEDLSFNQNNEFNDENATGSIISKYNEGRIKFLFFDIVKNIGGYDYYIPIKTLYSENIPQVSDSPAIINISLRDLFYLLESKKSPELLLTNVSLSYAITVLLDNIGFSNYAFKRTEDDEELIIPYFFVGPDQNIAETLQQLAISSQTAIFFDEFNNLVIMSKNYLLPSEEARPTNITLYGQEELIGENVALPNIINISSQDKQVYNGGEINYTTRYIQKTIGSIAQAPYIDEYKTYIYKPVLLWEVAGQEATKTINEAATQASGYSLAAMPIRTTLSINPPSAKRIIKKSRQQKEDEPTLDVVTLTFDSDHGILVGDRINVSGVGSNMDGSQIVTAITTTTVSYETITLGNIAETDLSPAGYVLFNYIIDFGENIYWLGNYAGYFYANGEIIRYDAVEYSVAGVGTLWIKNNQEYQKYFSQLKFNGKMYPTGRVRIYTNIQDGTVKEHGRAQFGTEIAEHVSGVEQNSAWTSNDNVVGIIQNAKSYLFNTNKTIEYPTNTDYSIAGKTKIINDKPYTADSYAIKSTRNGIIKNFMANTNLTENDVNYYKTSKSGSVQTSALVFNGPQLPSEIDPVDFVTYTYKSLEKPFKHFGTRMRIIGRVESGTNKQQTAIGSFDLYSPSQAASTDPSQQISITGGSGGLAFGLNKETNVGYYFEIAALSQTSTSSYQNNSNSSTYKIVTSPIVSATNDIVTVTLDTQHDFEIGTTVIVSGLVDDNDKTNQSRLNGEFLVTEISQNRKMFKYQIPAPSPTSVSITAATGNGSKIIYTANNHNFSVGQKVSITGMSNSSFNLSNVTITAVDNPISGDDTFTVASTVTGSLTSQSGTVTYQVLNTTSSNGGSVRVSIKENALISDIFFYKVVSGSNTSDIIKKYKNNGIVTLTTLRDHSFSVGEQITITDVGTGFDGTYQITEIGTKYFKYAASGTNVSTTDLDPLGLATSVNRIAIPEILWRGYSEILVDDGKFTTQSRLTTSEKTTVYDLSAEYLDIGTTRNFYLYLNNKQIAVVVDDNPLPTYNNIALFVRGSSRIMFENVYALSDNFADNAARSLQLPISKIFGDDQITESEAIGKYALSGIVQNTYLSGISSQTVPQYAIFYEEFGTIMREVAYFNIRYDRAYPALYAQLANTVNRVRGYTVSGFLAGSYGAEFLIFNAIDKNLNLDDTSGNYLRILGIAFTQNTTHSLKVDDFFRKNSNFTDSMFANANTASQYQKLYNDIQNSRSKYGQKDFSIDTTYVQTDAAAESMMDWIIKKTMYPRKTVGINVFGVPHLQLGDIVNINYKDNGIDIVCPDTTRFVVYNIEYSKDSGGVTSTIYLAEV